ncbi:MAG: hypothetical protein U0931_11340 [Vulcanimicrobiota bacterium]
MRKNRGECFLVTCATVGCLFVVAACCLVGAWFYFHKKSSDVRPMEHQTPARTVDLRPETRPEVPPPVPPEVLVPSPTPSLSASPAVEITPAYEELPPTISADGLMVGMGKAATAPSKLHVYRQGSLAEIHEASTLTVNAQEWKAGQKADLASLRKALPTRRESQKSERDGAVRHSFPQTGVEVQVWVKDGRYQRFALLKAP